MKKETQIILNTPRLILRLPNEADSIKLQNFDERNMSHLSPWKSTTQEPKKDHKTQL